MLRSCIARGGLCDPILHLGPGHCYCATTGCLAIFIHSSPSCATRRTVQPFSCVSWSKGALCPCSGLSGPLNGAMQPFVLPPFRLPSPSIGCSCSAPLLPAAALHPFSELQPIPLFLDCILSFRPQLMMLGDLLFFASTGNEATPQEQEQAAFVFLESVPWSRVAGTCVVVFFFLWKFLAGF